MTTPDDLKKMTDALDLPDALDVLSNSDREREAEAARRHPAAQQDAEDRAETIARTGIDPDAPLPRPQQPR